MSLAKPNYYSEAVSDISPEDPLPVIGSDEGADFFKKVAREAYKDRRQEAHITQEGLASYMGVSQATVSRLLKIEDTQAVWTAPLLHKFCTYLNIKLAQIVPEEYLGQFTGWREEGGEISENLIAAVKAIIVAFEKEIEASSSERAVEDLAVKVAARLDKSIIEGSPYLEPAVRKTLYLLAMQPK